MLKSYRWFSRGEFLEIYMGGLGLFLSSNQFRLAMAPMFDFGMTGGVASNPFNMLFLGCFLLLRIKKQ